MCQKSRSILIPLIALAVLAALPARAAQQHLTVDPETTKVTFTLGATGHDVEGSMTVAEGWLELDPETGAAGGKITLDARLAETGNKKRDGKMHKEVLESEQFPWITFEPHRVTGQMNAEGTSEVQIEGTLSIHGAEHEATLPASITTAGGHWTATTHLSVPFVEWGMKDPSFFVLRVDKVVEVTVSAAGSVEAAAEAAR